jgi:DNA (cytosine-5)-methyltransferase 1
LKQLGIDFECVGFSEIDKYAIKCFEQNHGGKNYGDIRNINPNELPDFDLFTGGFPCQAFSSAGKMKGETDPRGTLFYEIIRIAEVKKPKYMLLENVKGLTCGKFRNTFKKILSELNRIGYNVYWKVLNSKDFGIPQSRARVWFVCVRKDICCGIEMEKDKELDELHCSECGRIEHLNLMNFPKFKFPKPVKLNIFIKDILEENVDKKYYLSPLLQERFSKYLEDKETKIIRGRPIMPYEKGKRELHYKEYKEICPTLSENCASGDQKNMVYDKPMKKFTKDIYEINKENNLIRPSYVQFQNGHHSEAHRIYNPEGISQTLKPFGLKIYEKQEIIEDLKESGLELTKKGEKSLNRACGISNSSPRECGFKEDISPTLLGRDYKDPKIVNYGQLRRLTPKECFRLQGFLKDEINLDGLSDTQAYKLAGNGQDVNVVKKIFEELFALTTKNAEVKNG